MGSRTKKIMVELLKQSVKSGTKYFIKFLNCLKKYSAIIAVLAALLSAYFAGQSSKKSDEAFEYTKQLNKSSISLEYTSGNKEILSDNFLTLTYFFILDITGNESVNITNLSSAYFNFKTNFFYYLDRNYSFLSTLHPSANFVHKVTMPVPIENNDNENNLDLAIMIRIDYETQTGKYNVIYYLKHEPDFNSHYLSRQKYNLMESFLPEEFRLNPSE